ncbi:MAG: serine/threonine protein kinase [Sandaracinaceae bacterium]
MPHSRYHEPIEALAESVLCHHCGWQHPAKEVVCPRTQVMMAQPGMCGRTLDRYEIVEWIGGGGFGSVYRARHSVMQREVALKLVRPSPHHSTDVIQRFVTEARAAAAIGNPHIVEVYDAGSVADGTHFLAMELVKGSELGDVLRAESKLGVERALSILLQVLDALTAAHAAGIIHRDIKPGNIMLVGTWPGGAQRDFVKLLDFGISKAQHLKDTPTTKTGMSMGTPGYAAPEQYLAARTVDHRVDLYSASVVLYKMLGGTLPFEAETYEEMVIRVCTQAPTPLATLRPDLDAALLAIVDRGLRTQAQDRFQSAAELRAALQRCLDASRAGASPGSPAERTLESASPDPLLVAHASATHTPAPPSGSLGVEPTSGAISRVDPPAVDAPPPRRRSALAAVLIGLLVLVVAGGASLATVHFMTDGETVTPNAATPAPDVTEPVVEEGPTPVPDDETATRRAGEDPVIEPVVIESGDTDPDVDPDSEPVSPIEVAADDRNGRTGRRHPHASHPPSTPAEATPNHPVATPPLGTPTTAHDEGRVDPYRRPDLLPFDQ